MSPSQACRAAAATSAINQRRGTPEIGEAHASFKVSLLSTKHLLKECGIFFSDSAPVINGMRPCHCLGGLRSGRLNRTANRVGKRLFGSRIYQGCVLAKDPAGDLIIVRDNRQTAAERLNIHVSERLAYRSM